MYTFTYLFNSIFKEIKAPKPKIQVVGLLYLQKSRVTFHARINFKPTIEVGLSLVQEQ